MYVSVLDILYYSTRRIIKGGIIIFPLEENISITLCNSVCVCLCVYLCVYGRYI